MKRISWLFIIGLLAIGLMTENLHAQAPAAGPPADQAAALLSPQELDQLVGRIALYPDELVAIVLPASTYPLQIVQASRFLQKRKKNPNLKPRKDWDASVLGLLNYPEVIEIMNDDLDWIWKLGEAVIAQQKDVMDAIQQMRARANAAGNLRSNKQQVIVQEKEIIIIKSADPQVIYVPQYDPAVIVVQQAAPVTVVYSNPYPVYSNPAATFFSGMFVGAAISYGIGWNNHHIGYRHGGGGYVDGNINIDNSKNVNVNRGGDKSTNVNAPGDRSGNRGGSQTWKPGNRSGARPGTRPGSRPVSRPGSTQRGNFASRTSGAGRSGGGGARNFGAASRQQTQGSRSSRANRGTRSRFGSSGGSSRSGAFGGYGRGQKQRSYSNRGRQSRSSPRRNRSSTSSRSSGRSVGSGGRSRSGGRSSSGGRSRGGGRRR